MAYHPLADDSGQTPERRTEEAQNLVEMLEDHEDEMSPSDRNFYRSTAERFKQYGLRTTISVKQLFWLRDIKDRVL